MPKLEIKSRNSLNLLRINQQTENVLLFSASHSARAAFVFYFSIHDCILQVFFGLRVTSNSIRIHF